MAIKVLLADANESVRNTERSLLEVEPEIEVVGEASTARDAIKLANTLKPQVIVIDLSMNLPAHLGIATRHLKSEHPTVGVLAITPFEGRKVKSFIRAFGADELLDKGELATKLAPSMKSIART